tara:strand:+ start:658 stop:1107 length:450 start_codon:yes stop_codon:yes gene_type:complete
MSLNKATLIGNVGQDPEIRQTKDGKDVASFSLATSESWKDKSSGEKRDKTEWHRIVVFSQGLVGIIKSYVKKGSKLYLEGSLQTRKWTDKNDVEKYTTEIILQGYNSTLQMLDSKVSQNNTPKMSKQDDKALDNLDESFNSLEDDDIPF